jgi:hypothetical protein
MTNRLDFEVIYHCKIGYKSLANAKVGPRLAIVRKWRLVYRAVTFRSLIWRDTPRQQWQNSVRQTSARALLARLVNNIVKRVVVE